MTKRFKAHASASLAHFSASWTHCSAPFRKIPVSVNVSGRRPVRGPLRSFGLCLEVPYHFWNSVHSIPQSRQLSMIHFLSHHSVFHPLFSCILAVLLQPSPWPVYLQNPTSEISSCHGHNLWGLPELWGCKVCEHQFIGFRNTQGHGSFVSINYFITNYY